MHYQKGLVGYATGNLTDLVQVFLFTVLQIPLSKQEPQGQAAFFRIVNRAVIVFMPSELPSPSRVEPRPQTPQAVLCFPQTYS